MNQHDSPRAKASTGKLNAGKKRAVVLGAAALALPIILTPGIAFAAPADVQDGIDAIEAGEFIPGYQDEFLAQPVAADVYEHVRHLSVDIGPRVAGTDAEDTSIEYVQELLDSYGYETEVETFDTPVSNFADVEPSRDNVEGNGSWQFRPAGNAFYTGPGAPVDAELVDVGDGSDIDPDEVAGNHVLVNYVGDATVRDALLTEIAEAGAVGIILTQTSTSTSIPNLQSVPEAVQPIVVTTAGTFQGDRMRALLESGPLSLSITTQHSRTESSNVIGTLPAVGDTDDSAPIVYIGSHIDSVVGSPGASDNASGVAIMLESARILAGYDLDVEIRIGAWGAEERGIIGSAYHANSLTQDEVDRTIGAWNMDMAGTSFLGTDERPTDFWGLSVNQDNADNAVLNFASTVTESAGAGELNRGYVGRSDHQSFHDVGIDAAVFSWMYWSAETSIVLEPTYHSPSDTIDSISEDRLGLATQYIGGSAYLAALNTVDVSVLDESGEMAAGVEVAMSCEGDEGWREVGETDADGNVSTVAPHIECDFAALAENGAVGGATDQQIAGDTAVELEIVLEDDATTPPVPTTPGTTTPETTEPETTAPETTEPETTAPETTEPETTAPETTEPETTAPGTTTPGTTTPATTVPAGTAPGSAGPGGGDSGSAGPGGGDSGSDASGTKPGSDSALAQTGASMMGAVALAIALVGAGTFLTIRRLRNTASVEGPTSAE